MNKKRLFIAFIVIISLSLMVSGAILYYHFSNKIHGVFFRKMTGVLGVPRNQTLTLNFDVFSFGEKKDFQERFSDPKFNDHDISIRAMRVNEKMRDNDLIVYSVSFDIELTEYRKYLITSIRLKDGDRYSEMPIGRIVIDYIDANSEPIDYGIEPSMRDNQAVFEFRETNLDAFTIVGLKEINIDNVRLTWDKLVCFTPGENKEYCVNVNYTPDKKGDVLILQPIFEIQYSESDEIAFFIPFSPATYSEEMTYQMIRDYVK